MKSANVELRSQFLLRPVAEFANFELAQLVAEGLCGPRDVAVGLGLDGGLIHGAGLAEEIYDLIAGPSFGVNSGIDHQTHSPEEFGRQAAVIGNGILIETDLFAELLGVESPALDIGVEAQTVQAEFGESG